MPEEVAHEIESYLGEMRSSAIWCSARALIYLLGADGPFRMDKDSLTGSPCRAIT